MEPHDDPEARIRELERPLADVARAAELGTQPYGSGGIFSQPTLPDYGLPYTTSSRQTSTGVQRLRVVLLSAVFGLALLGGAIAFVLANHSDGGDLGSRTPDGRPNVVGGGGPLDNFGGVQENPSVDPAPGRLPGTSDSSEVITANPGEPVSVYGVGQTKTVACQDCVVNVSGVSNTVTILGHTVSLTVSGVENSVTVDSADKIGASGFENRIIYRSGSPEVKNSGSSNTVEQG